MKAKLSIKKLKFDGDKYLKEVDEALDIQIRQAARAWLRAVYPHVPVWSGQAKGSFIPIGQFLKVAIPISPNPSAKKHGVIRSPNTGANLAAFKFEHLKTLVRFSFSTNVEHYIFNEENNPDPPIHLIHPAPWHSFEFGKAAFFEYLKNNLSKKLPKLKDYFESDESTYP